MKKEVYILFNIKVNEEICTACGICVKECIHSKNQENTNHVDHKYLFCNQCLHCYAVCPSKAIEIGENTISSEAPGDIISYDDLIFLLKKRRSVRYFEDKYVEVDILTKILNSTRHIPSGGNNQDVSVTILKNKEKKKLLKKEIVKYYKNINKISQYKFIRILASLFGSPKIKEGLRNKHFVKKIKDMNKKLKTIDLIFYNAPVVIIIHTSRILPTAKEDAILVAYNIVLSAETMGLGSCFVSLSQQALNNKNICKEIIGIDKSDEIHAVVVLGYPVRNYKRNVFREEKDINIIN